ncbi:MAG TPA: hypothetical protein VKU44_00775 [Terriglobia bacterium]|nr:hypothetical protein [Terriglobia bacterium]
MTNTQQLAIGVDRAVLARFLTGNLYECGIATPAPSAAQQASLQAYFQTRYGV